MLTMTYRRELISFIVNHNDNDDLDALVLVGTFAGVEEPSDGDDSTSDTEASSSRCVFKPLGPRETKP
jgi:hypothetical protein